MSRDCPIWGLSHRQQQLLRCFLPVFFILSAKVSCQQTVVCGPPTYSQPLSCTNTQWVRIVAETYVPQTGPGSTCQRQNISACNAYFYDTGMSANCNGPARGGGAACREEVDVAAARRVTPCLQDVTDVATIIQYRCIEGSSVLNLCKANITMWTSNMPLYLASPGYVQLTPVGRMCTCDIQGSDLKVNAVEINVVSKLDWSDPAQDGHSYSDMFSVTSGDHDLWRSSNCAGCTTTNLLNSNLFLPVGDGTRYPNVTMTYSDFGLAGQNVWVEIFESGPSISVSCRSTPLPPDRMITTSTTTASTTSDSTYGKPTPSNMPTTTSPDHRTNTSPTETAASPTTKVTSTGPTEPPSLSPPSTSPHSTSASTSPRSTSPASTSASTSVYSKTTDAGNLLSADNQDDSSEEVTLIVTLTVILCVLVVIGAVLGCLIYRKRHIFKSDDYITPWVLIVSWYHRMLQQKPQRVPHQNGSSYGNFDSVLVPAQPRQQDPRQTIPDVHSSGRPSAGSSEPAQNCPDLSGANNSLLIPPELYRYHQQLLDEELDQMRRERSSKANLKMSTNVPLNAGFSKSKSLDGNSFHEAGSEGTLVQRQDPASETANMPVPTAKELYSATDMYMDPDYTHDASSNIHTDSRNTAIHKYTAETHRRDQACLSTDELRMFEVLGINAHPHKHNVRDRNIGSKKSPVSVHDKHKKSPVSVHDKHKKSPVSVHDKHKKASTAKEDNIKKSDMEKESAARSQDSESSCTDNTFPVASFHNQSDPGAPSHHWHGGKDSKSDIVSGVIQKCSQDIRNRKSEMNLPTTRNTSTSDNRTGKELETGVQTSEC